ncbi:MAG: contractile injection system protein, VgrG/Pvc8 family, partial [Caulobacteraceae bacterium]
MAASGADRNSFLRIIEAPGEVEEYFLFRLDGREMLSAPFEWRLTLRTHVEVPPPSGWIGASITFSMGGSDTVPRKVNGQCVRFEHAYQKGGYTEFVIDIAPSLMMTRLRRDYRIFTNVTAKQVINTILTEHGIVFDDTKVKYVTEVREYCVQYEESDFDFINRLMEDEGIFYFFKYDENAGRYKHKTYLADDPSGYYDGDVFSLSFRRDHLLRGLQSIETS